ncbi:phage holin family protein [Barrientosiimonas marina]|uniref:Phage holin family protein n=1 Tax=Lentibacillus kimchii TaxID=1542911 RepID=A0ABW2UVD7_9BACI
MLLRAVLSIILNAVALIVTAQLFSSFHLEGFGTAVLASIIIGILNLIVRPILVVLTLPVTVVTLGLFLFVINAVSLMVAQAIMDESFIIEGFGIAVIAAVIISVLNLLLNKLIRDPMT